MFPPQRTNAKLYVKNDLLNLKIIDGVYVPEYEPSRILINENAFLDLVIRENNRAKNNYTEHQIIEELQNSPPAWYSPFYLQNYKLFIHWYERKYKRNITNNNILINLNSFDFDEKNKIVQLYDKYELWDIILENIVRFNKSNKYEGYSLFYEAYYEVFKNIDSFNFQDFKGIKFLKYLLRNFPGLSGISTTKLHYIRFGYEEKESFNKMESGVHYLNKYRLPSFVPRVMKNELSGCRDLEDFLRIKKGLPKIGEGWISETTLYYLIKDKLDGIKVIHHGRPQWLGRQHFDIWIPELNVAIEYQGKQHDQPVEFFGGEEAFKENQKRDARKKKKCEENNVRLIEVREGYDLENLICLILTK